MTKSQTKIPKFASSWSDQMTSFLTKQTEQFIATHVVEICKSWGDRSKWDRVQLVLEEVIRDRDVLRTAIAEVRDWAGVDDRCWF